MNLEDLAQLAHALGASRVKPCALARCNASHPTVLDCPAQREPARRFLAASDVFGSMDCLSDFVERERGGRAAPAPSPTPSPSHTGRAPAMMGGARPAQQRALGPAASALAEALLQACDGTLELLCAEERARRAAAMLRELEADLASKATLRAHGVRWLAKTHSAVRGALAEPRGAPPDALGGLAEFLSLRLGCGVILDAFGCGAAQAPQAGWDRHDQGLALALQGARWKLVTCGDACAEAPGSALRTLPRSELLQALAHAQL